MNVASKSSSAVVSSMWCCQPVYCSSCWARAASAALESDVVSGHTREPTFAQSEVLHVVVTVSQGLYKAISGTIPKFVIFIRWYWME